MARPRARRGQTTRRSSGNVNANDNDSAEPPAAAAARQLPEHIRNRQRAVAEREAARLARPEARPKARLGHADRKKSAVTSTPFGFLAGNNSTTSATVEDTTWCGPFTVARQMIAAREEAKRKRLEAEEAEQNNNNTGEHHPLDAVMAELEEEQRRKAHPSLLWKSRVSIAVTPDDNATTTRKSKKARLPTLEDKTQHRVPSLYQMCVDFVVEHFDAVESLGDVDHAIRTSIAHELAAHNRLDSVALKALVEPDLEALELSDGSNLPQEALVEALQQSPTALRYLLLDQAGRCFGKAAVETLLNPYQKHATVMRPMPLFALHIGGAYLLQDMDAAKLVANMAPTLQSVAFKACPLLGVEVCRSIPAHYSLGNHNNNNNNNNKLLEFSLEDMTFSLDCWDALIGKTSSNDNNNDNVIPTWPRHLKSLTLRGMTGLQDDIVIAILQGAPELEHLDLSNNHDLTDACLSPLRLLTSTTKLRSLHLYNLKNITSIGLETLFTHGLPDMGPPPQLKTVHLSSLSFDAVTDQVCLLYTSPSPRD